MRLIVVFVLVFAFVAGCAHSPASFMPSAQPGDERAVLAEFCVEWEPACQRFAQEVLSDAAVQEALKSVRFVQFDLKDVKGSAAYEHFELTELTNPTYGHLAVDRVSRLLVFLGIVDDRGVRRYAGSPFDRRSFITFIESVAQLGGSESALRAAVDAAPDDPALLARAAQWYEVRRRGQEALPYWSRVAASAGAPAELRAQADWHHGALGRKGRPHDARAALLFAKDHPGTTWADHALAVAIVSNAVPPSEIEPVLRANFESQRDQVEAAHSLAWGAIGAHLLDLALTIAQQGMRLTRSQSPREIETLAEVYFQRGQKEAAISVIEQARAFAPGHPRLQADLDHFHHDERAPAMALLEWRASATDWSRLFYGDE